MANTILVIDDEESILQSLDGILTDEGFEVVRSNSGLNALNLIDEMGVEGFLDLLNRTGMLPPQIKQLEGEMGRDALLAFLQGLHDGDFPDPMDAPFDPPEPPKPKRTKKSGSGKPSADKKEDEQPQDPPNKQLNLFE